MDIDLSQMLVAALGGSPLALVVAAALRVVWNKYLEALADREELHAMIRDRDAAELAAWRDVAKPGESTDGTS